MTDLTASSPIFQTFLGDLQSNGGMTQAQAELFVEGAVELINQSPLLVNQLLDLQTKNWAITYQNTPGTGTDINGDTPTITIGSDSIGTVSGYNPYDPSATSFDGVANFVGALAHEVGHAEDPNNGAFNYTSNGNADGVAEQVAADLLSEGKAQLNNLTVAQQIFNNTENAIPVSGSSLSIDEQVVDMASNNPSQAVMDGASSYLYNNTSIDENGYLGYYWNSSLATLTNALLTNPALIMNSSILADLNLINNTLAVNTNAVSGISFAQGANGTDSMALAFASGSPLSSYTASFGYGAINPSGTSDAIQGGPQISLPTFPISLSQQVFNTSSGGSLSDALNPQSGVAEQITGTSGSNGTGTQLFQETDSVANNGRVSANITGSGDNSGLNNATITLSPAAQAVIDGINDTIDASGNSLSIGAGTNGDVVYGNNNSIGAGAGSFYGVVGNNSTVTASQATAFIGANALDNTIIGNNNNINTGTGSYTGVSGNSDALIGNAGTYYLDNGTAAAIIAGNTNTVDALASGLSFNVAGNNNVLNAGSNATIGINAGSIDNTALGTADIVNAAAGTYTGIAVTNGTVNGSGSSFYMDNGSNGTTVFGNGNSIIGNASGIYFGVTGTGNSINASNDSIYVDNGSSRDGFAGSGNSFYVNGNSLNVNLGAVSRSNALILGTNDGVSIGAGDTASMSGNDTGSSISATSTFSGETVNDGVLASSIGTLTLYDNASGSGAHTYTFNGQAAYNNVLNDTVQNAGTYGLVTANLSSGTGSGSVLNAFNPNNSLSPYANPIIDTAAGFSGANETGTLQGAAVGLAPITYNGATLSGVQIGDYFNINNTTNFEEVWNLPASGGGNSYGVFNQNGSFLYGNNNGLSPYGFAGNGGEFEVAQVTSGAGAPVTPSLTQFEAALPQGNARALQDAQQAFDENSLISSGYTPSAALVSNLKLLSSTDSSGSAPPTLTGNPYAQALYEGAVWDKTKPVTWSLAAAAGPADSPFSSYMGSQHAALLQKAFATWAGASGLTFEEVADSSQADIRIGWGSFNTSSSGVVGYTTYQDNSGQLDPGVIVRLEDPSQNALKASTAGGTMTYSGTNADLYQVMLHEIGHALGLADNDDPNSVMYYQAGPKNTTLDANDSAGMQVLYGSQTPSVAGQVVQSLGSNASGASMESMLQQLVQANASFGIAPASPPITGPAQTEPASTMLAASH